MSVILEALKKLDREKLSRRAGIPNIASEILKTDQPRPRKKILLSLVAVAVAAVAVTYVVLVQIGMPSKSSPVKAVPTSAPKKEAQVVPREIDSTPKPQPSVSTAPPPPGKTDPTSKIAQEEPSPVAAKPREDVQAKPVQPQPVEEKPVPSAARKEPESVPAPPKKPQEPPSRTATTPPSLRLSGIVWSEEPSKRIAVVNGITLSEGSTIEGVKVLEINPTRVRFQQNERVFHILLGSTLVMEE